MTHARFYHAGCPVCVSAEQTLLNLLDPSIKVEVIHLGDVPQRVAEAEAAGVQSVPALVVDGQVLHLNFGASIAELEIREAIMKVQVFDTHVRTRDGGYLHFDVLIAGNDQALATRYASEWLASRGVQDADVSQSRCQFCHSEPGHPEVTAAIERQGYFIIPLQGC